MEHPVYLGIGLFEHLSRGHFYRNFLNFLQVNFFSQFGLPQTQPAMARRPVPPQKPNERSIQQHFSSLASTDPYLYSAAGSMPPPPLPPPVHAPQPQNTQQHLYQQQQRQYMYAAADPNLAMVHQRPNAHAHHATNLPKMS